MLNKIGCPGTRALGCFITALMYSSLACSFFYSSLGPRLTIPALYERSRLVLNPTLGLANTLILLTSSWFMVRP